MAWLGGWRERWNFLTSRYLVVSSLPLFIAQAITLVMGLARNVLLTNFLLKEEYGALNYLMNWLSVIAFLALPGWDSAIAQYAAKGHSQVIGKGLRQRLLLGLAPIVALIIFSWAVRYTDSSEATPSLWLITALFFPTTQVLSLVGNLLGAFKQFRTLAGYSIGQSAAFLLAAALGLWLWPGHPLTGIVLLQWLFLSVVNIGYWFKVTRPAGEDLPLSLEQERQFRRFGTHLSALALIGQIQARIGPLLLGSFVSLSTLADYAIGDLFLEQMRALWNIYYSISYPRLITLTARERWKQVRRETLLATPAFITLTIAGGVALSVIIPWLFSAKYTSSLLYTWILLLAFVCSVPGGFFEMYFRVEEAELALYQIRVTSAVVGVLLPVGLLIWLGPLGVPIGRAVSNLVYSLVGLVLFRQRLLVALKSEER
jgi:O-antigen/teichoic acid export membrane protein